MTPEQPSRSQDPDEMESWQLLTTLLPHGWRDLARETGALTRARAFQDAETLLRTLLLHIGLGYSLRETVVRAKIAGWVDVSDVALLKRLRSAEEWLRTLALALVSKEFELPDAHEIRVRMVDATVVNEPGSTGTDWRLHYSLSLSDLRCDFFEVTDVYGGETFRRVPVRRKDLILGDRCYATPPGVHHVAAFGGMVLVRMTFNNLPLLLPNGNEFPLLERLRTLPQTKAREWNVQCPVPTGGAIPGRVCAIRKSKTAAQRALKKLERRASRKQQRLDPRTVESSEYFFVFSTAPAALFPTTTIFELYRLRWQIELAFKRLKSILGLGHLPKYEPSSCRAWLYGKLLVGLMAEKLAYQARSFSPWGYCLREIEEQASDR